MKFRRLYLYTFVLLCASLIFIAFFKLLNITSYVKNTNNISSANASTLPVSEDESESVDLGSTEKDTNYNGELEGVLSDDETSTLDMEEEPKEITVTIKKGDTFGNLMTKDYKISYSNMLDIVKAFKKVHFNITMLNIGKQIRLSDIHYDSETKSNIPYKLIFTKDSSCDYVASYNPKTKRYTAKKNRYKKEVKLVKVKGVINNSFNISASNNNIPFSIISNYTSIYRKTVSFKRDLRQGDSYEILFEYTSYKGRKGKNFGKILYANLKTHGVNHKLYYYNYSRGLADYFDKTGLSSKHILDRAPLRYRRISSHFGWRYHPVLHRRVLHTGVDFAAREGTPCSFCRCRNCNF